MTAEERARVLVNDIPADFAEDWEPATVRIVAAAIRAAEHEAAADLAFYRDREKHIAALLRVADGGQYRADWDGAVERLKREAADEALERAAAFITAKRRNRHHACRENAAMEIRSLKASKEGR